jgi:type IV secretory pathway VirB6-like protein
MSAAPALDRVLDHLRLRRAPGRPTQVHLSVTDRCFLPCLHCDIWKNKAEDLPTAFWLDAIDRLGLVVLDVLIIIVLIIIFLLLLLAALILIVLALVLVVLVLVVTLGLG